MLKCSLISHFSCCRCCCSVTSFVPIITPIKIKYGLGKLIFSCPIVQPQCTFITLCIYGNQNKTMHALVFTSIIIIIPKRFRVQCIKVIVRKLCAINSNSNRSYYYVFKSRFIMPFGVATLGDDQNR